MTYVELTLKRFAKLFCSKTTLQVVLCLSDGDKNESVFVANRRVHVFSLTLNYRQSIINLMCKVSEIPQIFDGYSAGLADRKTYR